MAGAFFFCNVYFARFLLETTDAFELAVPAPSCIDVIAATMPLHWLLGLFAAAMAGMYYLESIR